MTKILTAIRIQHKSAIAEKSASIETEKAIISSRMMYNNPSVNT